jgi:hypothetical protein
MNLKSLTQYWSYAAFNFFLKLFIKNIVVLLYSLGISYSFLILNAGYFAKANNRILS